ncbi:type VI secretion system amidase immunity protein Tai4 [Massilia aquatica]|nr:type VI secretion system amidase immunity protein Tai4 [Massilia aquatica]
MNIAPAFAALMLSFSLPAAAGTSTVMAPSRTNAENYKDRALSACIAEAYKGSPAGDDARITTIISLDWTYYDLDKGNRATNRLVDKYLRRDYSNPFEGYVGAEFKLLKCLDMYHSRELDEQVRKYVPHPGWVGDAPARRKKK